MKSLGEIFRGLTGKSSTSTPAESDPDAVQRRLDALKGNPLATPSLEAVAPATPEPAAAQPAAPTPGTPKAA